MYTSIKIENEAKVWVKRNDGQTEVIEIVREAAAPQLCYNLYVAFEKQSDCIGRILFDADGYWIYDGNFLTIAEQEQVAKFIMNYTERF